MKYNTCENCGANLDWGERCDCLAKKEQKGENQQCKKTAKSDMPDCKRSA